MVLYNSGAARAYECLSTSFIRMERDTRRCGAFPVDWHLNAFSLDKTTGHFHIKGHFI
jgi:hypothetical protein